MKNIPPWCKLNRRSMEPGNGVPGGGMSAGATNMSQLAPGVWGWAGADSVNVNLAMLSRDLDKKETAKVVAVSDTIIPGLLLGLEGAASDAAYLREAKVTTTIAASSSAGAPADDFKSEHVGFAFDDEETASILPFFPKAFKKIDGVRDMDETVLVYCSTGMASSALVVGYLMAREKLNYEEALAKVLEARPGALPDGGLNRNLSRQLKTWSKWPEFPGLPDWM